MIPRPDNRRHYNSRLYNLISWLAASVIVTAGVIYGLKLRPPLLAPPEGRHRGLPVGLSTVETVGVSSAPHPSPDRSARRPPSPRAGAGAKSIRYSRSAAPVP